MKQITLIIQFLVKSYDVTVGMYKKKTTFINVTENVKKRMVSEATLA
jgi:hypothetical protein